MDSFLLSDRKTLTSSWFYFRLSIGKESRRGEIVSDVVGNFRKSFGKHRVDFELNYEISYQVHKKKYFRELAKILKEF